MPKSKSVSPDAKKVDSLEAPKKTKKAAEPRPAPNYGEIALRAYHIYLERGATPGDPMQDWLQAERELAQAAPKKPGRKSKIVSIAA